MGDSAMMRGNLYCRSGRRVSITALVSNVGASYAESRAVRLPQAILRLHPGRVRRHNKTIKRGPGYCRRCGREELVQTNSRLAPQYLPGEGVLSRAVLEELAKLDSEPPPGFSLIRDIDDRQWSEWGPVSE